MAAVEAGVRASVPPPQELSPDTRAIVAALGELASRVASLEAAVKAGQAPVSTRGRSTGGPLTVALNLQAVGGVTVEVCVISNGPATFFLEGSVDGTTWRLMDQLVLAAPGDRHQGYWNAYPFVRVRTEDMGDHEIEMAASR